MAISPWVPAAFELGSLAFSGVGSWLSSRDQRKYQEDIRRMQEDARKRVADAQKVASQRANYFSIMTKQRIAPDPVNIDLPVIPAYNPGNWTQLMSGLGKGLGYAAKGASAFHTAQTYSEKLASQAGMQAAQRDAWEAKQTADVTGQSKPYSPYDPKSEDTYTVVDTSRSYLDHLGALTDEKAYNRAQADGSVFSGLFSGDADKSFKASYAATLMDAHDSADALHRTNVYQEATLRLKQQQLDAQARETKNAAAGRLAAKTQSFAKWEIELLRDFRKDILGPDFRDRIARVQKFDQALNLVKQSTGEQYLLNPATGKALVDSAGNNVLNPDYGIIFDGKGQVSQVKITGGVADALMQVYQRTRDEGVVHEGDVDRIRGSMDTFFGVMGGHSFQDWYDRLGTDNELPRTLTPQQTFQLVKILEADRKFIFESIGTEAHAIATSTANSISAYSDGGAFRGWGSTKELLENLTGQINDVLDPYTSPGFISDIEADYIKNINDKNVWDNIAAAADKTGDKTADLSSVVTGVAERLGVAERAGKRVTLKPRDNPEFIREMQDSFWNDYAGKGTVIAEAAKIGGRTIDATNALIADATENFTIENLYRSPRLIRDALPVEGMFLKENFQNPNQNPNAGFTDYAAYYGGRGAETLIASPFKAARDAYATLINTGHAVNTTLGIAGSLDRASNALSQRNLMSDAEAVLNIPLQYGKTVGDRLSQHASTILPSIEPLQGAYDYGRDKYNTGSTFLSKILTDPNLWALISSGRRPYGTRFPTAGGVRPPSGLGGQ